MTSTSRGLLTLFLIFSLMSAGTAQITDNRAPETDFSIPEYESNQEILTKLIAPFVFLYVLMQYTLSRALHITLDRRGRPETDKETTLLSLAIVTMLVPSPFWNYVELGIESLGLIGLLGFGALFIFTVLVLTGLR